MVELKNAILPVNVKTEGGYIFCAIRQIFLRFMTRKNMDFKMHPCQSSLKKGASGGSLAGFYSQIQSFFIV